VARLPHCLRQCCQRSRRLRARDRALTAARPRRAVAFVNLRELRGVNNPSTDAEVGRAHARRAEYDRSPSPSLSLSLFLPIGPAASLSASVRYPRHSARGVARFSARAVHALAVPSRPPMSYRCPLSAAAPPPAPPLRPGAAVAAVLRSR